MRLRYLDRLAVIFHRAAGDILFQHVQRFEERIARRFQRNPEPVELVLLISRPHADHGTAVADHVQHADFFQHAQRMVQWRHDHCGAKPDLRRLRCQRDGHRKRRRAQAVVGEMVLGEPGDVEADLLRHFHLLDHLLIQLPRRH